MTRPHPAEPCPEKPHDHDPTTGTAPRDFDPTAAFLAGDYVAAAALCPRCGTRSDSVLDGQRTCQHCGMVFTQEREHR
jgi:ribosomal protein L37E